MPSSLEKYYRKRNADQTPEPYGTGIQRPGVFVVHKHWARRMHYDLRLEIGGTLRSWAVPRGPSFDPQEKRLAVHVEDHPIDYADFEGVIPEGNYGAGAMIIWDRGIWVPLEEPDGKKWDNKLLFELRGFKLGGVWALIKTKGHGEKDWLLIKKPDAYAQSEPYEPVAQSIVSGLTVEDLKAGRNKNLEILQLARERGARESKVDFKGLKPMLAKPMSEAFSSSDWIFELKYDGYRLLCEKDGSTVSLRYRSGINATELYPEITDSILRLPLERVVFDGEAVVLDQDGKPSFQSLQKRAQLTKKNDILQTKKSYPVTLFVFDVLGVGPFDLRSLDTLTRKTLLRIMAPLAGAVRYSDHIDTRGEDFLVQVQKLNLEGIIAKRKAAPYRATRSGDWLKFRTERTDEFAVVGYTLPKDEKSPGLSAIHLGQFRGESLVYAGRVGSGMTGDEREHFRALLDQSPPLEDRPVLGRVPRTQTKSVWVPPRHLVEVRFLARTDDGLLRHPVFVAWREDKSIDEIQSPTLSLEDSSEVFAEDQPRRVTVTNEDKVFWPDEGYTKGDLIQYYRSIADWILPYLCDRMVVLARYPDGIAGKNFYQKDAPPFVPAWVETKRIWSEHSGREIDYFICNDLESLVFLVNLGSIPLHVWASRRSDTQAPDWVIIDLDPKGAPFKDVVTLAKATRKLCEEIELPSFVKTSGSTGLHVLIPIGQRLTYEQGRRLAELLANVIAHRHPDIATTTRNPRKRDGKVYLDYLQNRHGQLLVVPFCVRPLPGAPVSVPLEWREVNAKLTPGKFTIKNVPRRMAKKKKDPMSDILTLTPDVNQSIGLLSALIESDGALG